MSRMESVPFDLNCKYTLNDGFKIPCFGFGTYKCSPGNEGTTIKSVEFALRNGYRLLDTAQFYENEKEVGQGIIQSGIPREEIYVVTKEWKKVDTKESFMESLEKLGTGYVDLFLIHNPKGGNNMKTYDDMIELQSQGLIRSIGVSNFGIDHLEHLKKANKPTPAVNQIELHPFCRYNKVVNYCRQHGITVMGFCPVARGRFFDDPTIVTVAQKNKRTPAQVMLRWSIQSGFVTIPKSENPERIKANADIFDFSLSEDDMKELNNLPTNKVTQLDLDIPWEG